MTTANRHLFCPSPTNPRTRFGGPEDEALGANIKAHGIIQPLVVRPWPAGKPIPIGYPDAQYEIVCGHRRYFGAMLADLFVIPHIVKDLTDEQVVAIQLIENLQREGLDALDEAEGYQRMIRDHGYSADRLAEEIGKSRSYIYGRLKLTSLCPAGKAAMREGRLEESIALMLARIPGAALQEKALNGVLNPSWSGADPMTHREASRYIRDYYTLNLGKAPFLTWDADLLAKAGGCQECPHRSGNAPLLFPDIDNPEICTNPECFADKKAAHVARQKALAEAEGKKVIEGEAAQKLITGQYHGGLKGHTNLDDKAYDIKTGGELRTYREILGDALDESQTVIIENPHKGEVIEALPNSVMAKALEKAGLKPAGAPQFDRQKEEERKAREETAWRRHLHNLVQTLRASTLASKALLLVDELVMVTLAFWEAIGHDQRVVLAKLWHQPEEKMDNHERERAFTDRIPGLSQAELLRLQLDLSMAWELTCHTYSTGKPTRLLAAAERAGIDVEAEKTAFKVGNEAKKAGKTAKPAPKPTATAPSEAISTPPEAALAGEVIAPEPKAALAGDENPGEREEESPATAGEGEVEKPAQAETLRFQVGDVVRIVASSDGDGELDAYLGQQGEINHVSKSICPDKNEVLHIGLECGEKLTVYPDEVERISSAAPAQPVEEAIETNETPSPAQLPHFQMGDRVQVKADAKGLNGIRCKCAGRTGTVINKGTHGCRVMFDSGQGGEPTANVLWSNLEKLEIETDEKPSLAHRTHLAKLVKYRHPDIADLCWSGRGRQPVWVANWINEGGTLDDLAAPTPKPAKAGKRQQSPAVTTSAAEAAYRCEKTVDMFQEGRHVPHQD